MGFGYILLFFFSFNYSFAQLKNEAELKKQADKDFENEEYALAYKLYSQLVSLYPRDPEYNYRLGVCMLYTDADKKKPFSYLKIATSNPKEAPKDAKFYLAKTYHVNYKFDEAIKLYNEFKQIGSSSSIKKLQVDREIESCKNGKRLLSNLSDLVVISKKQLNEADYFRSYDTKDIGGKLLVKPDDFRSFMDKRKKEKSVIYLPRNGERVYYSSYGETGDKGRDIYFVNKLPNGEWSKPQAMPSPINTEYDEDYPFLHPNGKTLYFSSKGHNSMGGYDVFKTTYNSSTQTWSKPVNLEFPINSPDDDILFVTDSLEKQAYFSTGRYSPYGKLDVLKISTERRPMDFAFLKGTVVKEEVTQSLKSKITVKNMANGEIVGTYQAQDNGDYTMDVPNGGKFLFTVETPGLPTQSEGVQIPIAYSFKPYKQLISYENKKLKIINYFDGQIADENYSVMLDLIEKKAKLEVNENEPYNNALKNQSGIMDENANLNAVNTTRPTIVEDNGTPKNNANKNVTNEQLLSIAKMDAKEAGDEAKKLKKEAQEAFGLATQKTAEAVGLEKKADAELIAANSITDLTKKNSEVEKANNLKDEAKIATDVANTATNMAKKLEVDANLKQKESDLTNQYITELEAITKNKNNKEALTKLEKIQKELDDLSKQKNQSDELFESLKAESVLKQTELTNSENKSNEIVRDINNIKNENKTLETDLANETDKSIKENISSQIRELNNDIDLKNKDLEVNNSKIEKLKNELEGINKEIEVAAKILNEKTDVIVSNKNVGNDITEGAVITNTVSNNVNSNPTKITYNELTQKYTDILNPSASSKEDLNKQNSNLKNYNSEIGNLVAIDKTAISNTKDSKEKKRLNEEIKNLEKLKSENDKTIVSNSNKVKEFDAIAITNTTVSPNDNTNAINSNSIASVNSNAISPSINLLNEAETLNNKAFEERKEAKTKTGIEKDNLIKQAVENEKLAIDKKLEASEIIEKENKTSFENNLIDIANLNKLSEGKTSEAIAQAKKLESESQLNFKQAEKLRAEADKNNSNSAKLGGYSNAEEKEAEAIAKQEKSLELLLKENPTYQKQGQAIVDVNNGITNSNNTAITSNSNSAITNTNEIANNTNTQTNGIGDEASKLKSGLNNTSESNLKSFNAYSNSEAIITKDQALVKINDALSQDKEIVNQLDNITELSKNTTTINEVSLQSISDLISEADKLNDEAFKYRQTAKSKTGDEKEKDLASAKKLETEAVSKKISAASAQENYNSTLFNANKESLNELQQLAKGKNLQELNNAEAQAKEINLLFEKAKSLRQEANGYPTDAAKLGGIGNAEEKENTALTKQDDLIKSYKKYFPDYEVKSTNSGSENNDISNKLNDTKSNLNTNNQKHIDGLVLLASANEKEFKSRMLGLATNMTADQTILKSKAQAAYKLSKEQLLKANETTDQIAKKDLLVDANKNGQESINLLSQISANTSIAKNNNAVVTNTSVLAVSASTVSTNNNSIKTNTVASINNNGASITNTTSAVSSNTLMANSISSNSVASTNPINGNSNNLKTNTNPNNGTSSLKAGLNNESENNLKIFNAYTNSEAISLKEQALAKIIAALDKDKAISNQLNDIDALAKNNSSSETINQQSISDLTTSAEKLNDEAFKLRQAAITKTGDEKEKDLSSAKQLESEAVSKKINAAKQQQQFNSATYEANQKSLEDLKQMAQGKNISELGTADMQMNEANLFFSKAKTLREEANAYPTDAAKLGGYGNAEEKENMAIAKQEALLNTYKKYFSNYELKQPIVKSENPEITNKLNDAQKTIDNNNTAHNEGLIVLSQANDKEYNSRVLSLPVNLTANQISLKSKAQLAFEKSKTLVAKANQTSDALLKKEILVEANQNGQEAINLLNQIIGNAPIANIVTSTLNNTNPIANNTPTVSSNASNKNNTNSASNNTVPNNTVPKNNNVAPNANSNNTTNTNNAVKLKVEGLEVKTSNAYTPNKPIPIDEKIQDGLVFKVQIGAFKQPLPNGTFKGLTPVIAQTTPSGYLRYMAGNFEKYESANAVKNDLKNLGYSDAFVVAYYNGVRVNLNEGVEKAKAAGQIVSVNNNTSAGLTTNNNVPKNTFTQPNKTVTDNSPVEITNELEKINGLLYTVQIGVYSKEVTRSQLSNLKPIFTEKLPSGLYRYTAGIYNQSTKLLDDKQKVISLGVKDAFVSAYYNAKRIPFVEGKKLQLENQSIKMEVENPIIFPNGSNTIQPTLNAVTPSANTVNNVVSSPTVSPFNNGVTSGPAPTPENGVKIDDAGISFKVQIGAYKNQVPNDVAAKFLNIKTWPVNNIVLNALYIYTIGNFNGVSFAKKLRDEAVSVGISDAYITVYKDGKKLYGNEATTYLSK